MINEEPQTEYPLQVVLMGVSGCGKTTVAGLLSERLGWEVAEADDFHPRVNIEKMESGHPEDRWPWLRRLRDWMHDHEESTIVTCSALKRSYRDVLRESNPHVVFFHLDGDREVLESRLRTRSGHFFPVHLLDSQLDTLEPLELDEQGFVLDISKEPQELVDSIISAIVREDEGYARLTYETQGE